MWFCTSLTCAERMICYSGYLTGSSKGASSRGGVTEKEVAEIMESIKVVGYKFCLSESLFLILAIF